ncbi:MAG: radical SAM/SPASM domain-containing protein, partial [bacterium]|nr:radical SAM/SPASM domain-containing protein [bacterium]
MESIYWVITWLCHRRCVHCYEDRFRPYHGQELDAVVAESAANFERIVENLPERMTFLDPGKPLAGGGFEERRGRIILAGGEILLEPVREPVLYPAIEMLNRKYRDRGGLDVFIQTTGDVVTGKIVAELLERGVHVISVSGMDHYHEGLEQPEARERLKRKLTAIFEAQGMTSYEGVAGEGSAPASGGPYFHFFGAEPDSWIGPIWPRGRAFNNEISTATLADNFCNGWSGGLHFLDYKHAGSEVSIEPNGNVYPCCIKTKAPVGNLLEQPLEAILDGLTGNPVYEAISMGHPERMGIAHGWSVEKFIEMSQTTTPSGRQYRNICIGCDRLHEEVIVGNHGGLVKLAG